MIRSPVIVTLGHVDHGKTSLLDFIRGTAVALREPGAITQMIGASTVPLEVIQKLCGPLLDKFKIKFTIPGLLFIDTPGHEVFTNLRKRGGSTADIAIVVIDIMQGMQPQTREAIEILKTFKVPFVVAANKIDMLQGWKNQSSVFIQNFEKQNINTKEFFDKKFYTLVGQLSETGFDSDLYTKVDDYRKRVSIVPVSARTGEGVAELLALLTGLAQKFLGTSLEIDEKCSAKGTVLEIKEETGLGVTADAIIYDGCIKVGDVIVLGGVSGIIKTKVKALLRPLPLVEMRDARRRFEPVREVFAASGVKIVAPDLDKAIAGTPLLSGKTDAEIEAAEKSVSEEIESIVLQTDDTGIILKTDTLGSLEAVAAILRKKNICIKKLGIGPISRADVMAAAAAACSAPLETFVLGFNVKADDPVVVEAEKQGVTVITDKIIYHLIERFEQEIEKKRTDMEKKALEGIIWPGKFRILPGFVFRASHPAVFGVEVIGGKIKPRVTVMTKDAKEIGDIKEIEDEGKKLQELKVGEKAAVSVEGITIGRQVKEGDTLFVAMTECNFRALKENKELLSKAEIEILKEIAVIKRKEKETWGV
ncbi:MAG: translation initiation factor IF-2 [archaeon]